MIPILVFAGGVMIAAAALLVAAAFTKPQPDLAAVLGRLANTTPTPSTMEVNSRARIGTHLMTTLRLRPSPWLTSQLRIRGIDPARFYTERLICAAVAALLPVVLAAAATIAHVPIVAAVPGLAIIGCAAAGWWWPVWHLRRGAPATSDDTNDALLVFVDLVVLERGANVGARDALARAAATSDNPLFQAIRATCRRADLEQEPPWPHLKRLAAELQLPALADIADVARLQDQGGALSPAFRARVKELRGAALTRSKLAATAITRRMEYAKTLPVVIVLAALAVPPLLRLLSGS